jgi:pimeloyl-ACP methyl ester carboxylesterase
MDLLASAGYRVLALNQRGYSPAATPKLFWRYRLSKLMADVSALINSVAGTSVHLVGHDLGAEVAWNMAAARPHLLRSLTTVSTPHPRALTGPYDFRILEKVSHWIPEEAPRALADLIESHACLHSPQHQ